ncbi:MAG: surface antigen protein, partial [bacterium]
MLSRKRRSLMIIGLFVLVTLLAVFNNNSKITKVKAFASSFPNNSSPIVLNNGNRFVWVVNPDNNSVTRIDIGDERSFPSITIPVGREPQSLVLSVDDTKVYVANTVDGTVSIISTATSQVIGTITVGIEPRAVVLSPNGTKLYVANSNSSSVSVIDTKTDKVTKEIKLAASPDGNIRPYALAITNDGDFDDNDERILVTNFLGQYRANDVRPGADDGKVGQVFVIDTARELLTDTITLDPMIDTGFSSNGSALKKVTPGPADRPNLVATGAFPNLLNSIVIKGNRAYISTTGYFGIQFEPDKFDSQNNPLTRFVTIPYALAFKKTSSVGYVVSSLSNMLVQVNLDNQGKGSINAPKVVGDTGNITRILVGKNPRGIVIRNDDARAYVMNYV